MVHTEVYTLVCTIGLARRMYNGLVCTHGNKEAVFVQVAGIEPWETGSVGGWAWCEQDGGDRPGVGRDGSAG